MESGYIIADQSPTALIPGVIKNTALKLVKRLVDRDDRGCHRALD